MERKEFLGSLGFVLAGTLLSPDSALTDNSDSPKPENLKLNLNPSLSPWRSDLLKT